MNMNVLDFHPLTLADKATVLRFTLPGSYRNCDLNFMNLCSWRFLYQTEIAVCDDRLFFRFQSDGHLAYQYPIGTGPLDSALHRIHEDALRQGHPFLLLGVCEEFLPLLEEAWPGFFRFKPNRDFSDYIYLRSSLESLSGKKLQAKRNHANRFQKEHPDYRFEPLTRQLIPQCLELEQRWTEEKEGYMENPDYAKERRSIRYVLEHWDALDGRGGCLMVDNRMVAFTFGAPINHETFDVCVEKADATIPGAYAVINRDFVRSLPPQYRLINREEDLGIDGLRQAKLSYQPHLLLHKYVAMDKQPLHHDATFG